MINRKTISDWNDYLSTLIVPIQEVYRELTDDPLTYMEARKYDIVHTTPKFNFTQSVDVEKENVKNLEEALQHCNKDLLELLSEIRKSDLTSRFAIEYTDEKNTRHFDPKVILISWTMKCTKTFRRPLIEAGAPIDTLLNEYDNLTLRYKVKQLRGGVQRKKQNFKPISKIKRGEEQEEKFKTFFKLLNMKEDDVMLNNYKSLFECISHPVSENVVHILSPEHLSFVYKLKDNTDAEKYDKYLSKCFDKMTEFDDEDKSTNYVHFEKAKHIWIVNESFHLIDDYYVISIENNVFKRGGWQVHTGDMVMLMNEFIENFDNFNFDVKQYPGNLYIGNICKILS